MGLSVGQGSPRASDRETQRACNLNGSCRVFKIKLNLGSDIPCFLPYSLGRRDQPWCTVGEVGGGWVSREGTKLVVESSLGGAAAPEDVTEGVSRETGLRCVCGERTEPSTLGLRTGERCISGICIRGRDFNWILGSWTLLVVCWNLCTPFQSTGFKCRK